MATKHKQSKNKLDAACRKYILARDNNKCVICGSGPTIAKTGRKLSLHQGHFLGKNRICMRWNEKNIHAQCCSCNYMHEQNCIPYYQFMQKKYGLKVINQLHNRWKVEKVHYTISDMDFMTDVYKTKLKEII